MVAAVSGGFIAAIGFFIIDFLADGIDDHGFYDGFSVFLQRLFLFDGKIQRVIFYSGADIEDHGKFILQRALHQSDPIGGFQVDGGAIFPHGQIADKI